jgi:hypothetical protein
VITSSTAIHGRSHPGRRDNIRNKQVFALILGSKAEFDCLTVLPRSARKSVRHPDVEHRVIAIGNDVDPEVVITSHHSELKFRDVSTSLDMTNEGRIVF